LIDGVFDFGGAKAMATNVDHVVHASDDTVESVFISAGAVACEI
jgi:hypothetical protein